MHCEQAEFYEETFHRPPSTLHIPSRTLNLPSHALHIFGGGGGAAPELTAVFKLGSEPVQYTLGFGAGSGRHDGELEVAFVDGKLVIAGQEEQPLTPGTWTFAIHNSGGAGALNGISVTFEQ